DGAPRATASYQTTERLVLTVAVPARSRSAARTLRVELLGPDKTVIDKATRKLPARSATSQRFEFPTPKVAKDQITVRTRLDKKQAEVPLNKILLARAHETSLTASANYFPGSMASLRCAVQG